MKKFIAIIAFVTMCLAAYSQNMTVSGTVRDSKGEPVMGAVVMLEGNTSTGVTTDLDGKYSITIPSSKSQTLVVSCLSFKEARVSVKTAGIINVTLEDDAEVLEEVVVVGYGAMRKSDLTGSVASVKINDDDAAKSATLDQMMEGRAAGVQVLSDAGSPDAGVSIRVRGIATFTGNSDPLYVVDGVIINGESQSIATMTKGTSANAEEKTNGLSGINPQDIASIEILKDASATAIYGSQGANGVVLITTKSANKDIPVVRFNAGVSISQRSKKLDVCNFSEWADLQEMLYGTSELSKYFEDPAARTGLKVTPVDWQDYVTRLGIGQRYYVSVAGRPKGYNYMFSLGYNRVEGVMVNNESDNITGRLNLDKTISKHLKLGTKTSFGYTHSNLLTGAVNGGAITSRSSMLRSVLMTRPYLISDEEEDEDDAETDDENKNFGPRRWINNTTNISERFRVNPSIYALWTINKVISFKSTLGGEIQTNERKKTKGATMSVGYGNTAGVGESQSFRYNWDNLLMFNGKWGKHSLSGTLGHSMSYSKYSEQSIAGYYLIQPNAGVASINLAESTNSEIDSFAIRESSLLSFFGRAIYNYNDRYVLTATLRFDGSSKFYGANQWGVFPSFAFAWRIAEEPWFNIPCISNAKLRLGWGQVGNQAISGYQTQKSYTSRAYGNHFNASEKETSLKITGIANMDLKWETSNQINAGLDLSFWKGRLALTIDAYRKFTEDLLQSKNLPFSTGFNIMDVNDGSIQNTGLEFTVDSTPLKIGEFEWGLTGNLSINRNKIVSIGQTGDSGTLYLSPDSEPVQAKFFYGDALQSSGDTNPLNIFVEGQSMGLFYGYATDGIVQVGETGLSETGMTAEPGEYKFRDLNGNGILDVGDRCIIGNPLPKFTYGFGTSFRWKNLSLSLDFSGSYGADIYNLNNMMDWQMNRTKNTRLCAVKDAWSPENPGGRYKKIETAVTTQLCDLYVEDGSYLRLSNIALSYDVPISKKSKVLHGLNLSLSVGNLFIWSKYSGYSALANSYGTSVRRMGVDLNAAALPYTYNFDVKFTF